MRRAYRAERIVVFFNPRLCSHVGNCLRGLPEVFNRSRNPWVAPDAAAPESVVEAVISCPTGALQFRRLDGGPEEPAPAETTVTVMANGPINVRGKLEIKNALGEIVAKGTRFALCRCGNSKNMPFCDGSHVRVGFQAE